MSHRAVAVNAGGRMGGNTERVLQAVVAGMRAAGADAQLTTALAIGQHDGADAAGTGLREALHGSDVWVLGAPVELDAPSEHLRMLTKSLWHWFGENGALSDDRAAAVVLTCAAENTERYEELAREAARHLRMIGGFPLLETLVAGGLRSTGDSDGRPDVLARARTLGERLIRSTPVCAD